MTTYFVASARGNPNYSANTIAEQLVRIYGKDFFKKLPIIKESGMLRYLINKLRRGQHVELYLSESAHDRWVKMNEKLTKKGVVPPISICGCEDAEGVWIPEVGSFLINKRLPRWFGNEKGAAYVHFFNKEGELYNDRILKFDDQPVIYTLIKTVGIPWLLMNIETFTNMAKHCKVTGDEFFEGDDEYIQIFEDRVETSKTESMDNIDEDEDGVYIDDDINFGDED